MNKRRGIELILVFMLGGLAACTPTAESDPDPIAVGTSGPTSMAVPTTSVPSATPPATAATIEISLTVSPDPDLVDVEPSSPTNTAVPAAPASSDTPSPTASATQFSPTVTPYVTPTPWPTFTPQPAIKPTAVGPTEGHSNGALISDDGRYVTFRSSGRLTSDAAGIDMAVFLRDTVEGTTTLLNVNLDGLPTIHDVYGATMSGDARLFAYFSFDGNIVPGDDAECGPVSCEDLFVFDREMGTTTMVPLGRSQGLGGDFNMGASSNGRYIALGHDDNLLLYDNETKVAEPQLTTIDGEAPNGRSFAPSLSADGRFIAFVSRASNLVPGDTNEQADVFVLDRASALMERVSLANDGTQADGPSGSEPAVELVNGKTGISADGRFVTFASASANLGNEPLFECQDYRSARLCYQVYLHDRDTGTTEVISKGGDNDSLDPAISADGQFIVFTSMASNLTANALPSCEPGCVICCGQIYLFDREANQLHMLTAQANAGSWGADLSGNGRYITFTSLASNLVAAGSNGQSAIYRYDRDTDQFEKISVANLP